MRDEVICQWEEPPSVIKGKEQERQEENVCPMHGVGNSGRRQEETGTHHPDMWNGGYLGGREAAGRLQGVSWSRHKTEEGNHHRLGSFDPLKKITFTHSGSSQSAAQQKTPVPKRSWSLKHPS